MAIDRSATYATIVAELTDALTPGWNRVPDDERAGFSVVVTGGSGDYRARVVTNVSIYPEWLWTLTQNRQIVALASASTTSAAEAIQLAESVMIQTWADS